MIRDTIDINSNDNALYVTSQCNNRCLMCCQPPNNDDDLDYFYNKNISIIDNAPKNLPEIGVTGGEPTLLNERFFTFLQHINSTLPDTHIQVLSNGRRFSDFHYCMGFESINKKQLLIGIPLHSDYCGDHDLITQIKGSYAQTMKGLYNLGRHNVQIELRIVINKLNYQRLPQISSFIYRNLPFVRYLSFMGMEITGWAVKNKDHVWIDPIDYQSQLEQAVLDVTSYGMDAAIFNLPHCLLPITLHPYATKSISDWKTVFMEHCDRCFYKEDCCGLFATSRFQSMGIKTIRNISF